STYSKVFNCPTYKNETYSLTFGNQHLSTPIITANYNLQQLLLNHVANSDNQYDKHGEFSRAVFNFLTSNSYLFSISIDFVAAHFNISIRSLQRKLKQERSEEHTSELQSRENLVCRLLLEKKNKK